MRRILFAFPVRWSSFFNPFPPVVAYATTGPKGLRTPNLTNLKYAITREFRLQRGGPFAFCSKITIPNNCRNAKGPPLQFQNLKHSLILAYFKSDQFEIILCNYLGIFEILKLQRGPFVFVPLLGILKVP